MQQIVEFVSNRLSELKEARLTDTYQVVFCFHQLEHISYQVLGYLNTGALQFEEFSEHRLFPGEVKSSST
jgi:hypothetical protein